MTASRSGRRTALATGFAVLFVGTGSNFTFGVLFRPILDELGGDRSTLALAATLSLLVNAVSQPALGGLVDRFGPRRVILWAMALMAVGTALASRVGGPWQFIALYGVVIAVGYTGCGILPVSVHVSRWFPGERGFVSAVAATGFSLGQVTLTQVAARAAAPLGWRRHLRAPGRPAGRGPRGLLLHAPRRARPRGSIGRSRAPSRRHRSS